MNDPLISKLANALMLDLKAFAGVCEEVLSLAAREYQALAGRADYHHADFSEKRKTLLPDIEMLVKKFRNHRLAWQQIPLSERNRFTEIKAGFESIQGMLMRVLQLDRENQQAMLKRGLVPVKDLPGATVQAPNFVANLYRRNSTVS